MFVAIRIYRDTTDPAEIDRRIVGALVPVMRRMPGFRSYTTADLGGGSVMSVSLFDSRAEAETATAEARGLVQTLLTDLVPKAPEVRLGEVMSSTRGEGAPGSIAIRTYRDCADAQALDRRIAAQLMPALRAMAGFRGYTTVDLGGGTVASISTFDTAAHADAANVQVRPLVAAHLADLIKTAPDVLVGRVLSETRA